MQANDQAWRDAAQLIMVALAKNNQFIVADMMIIYLQSAGYGLDDYSKLTGVFRRASKQGIIVRVPRKKKQALWLSNLYKSTNKGLINDIY